MFQNLVDLEILKRSSEHLQALQSEGYEVSAPRDYSLITNAVAKTGRKQQTPMLSLARNDFTRGDAFWLFLEKDGEPVAGCAAKFCDLKGEAFDAYLRRTSQAQYQRSTDPIVHVAKPVVDKLCGSLIYIGELEFSPEHRGKPKVLYAFLRLLQALAALKWPDFHAMYAILPNNHIKFSDGYGFNWKIPAAITWQEPIPAGRLNDHWIVAIDRLDFDHCWSLKG